MSQKKRKIVQAVVIEKRLAIDVNFPCQVFGSAQKVPNANGQIAALVLIDESTASLHSLE